MDNPPVGLRELDKDDPLWKLYRVLGSFDGFGDIRGMQYDNDASKTFPMGGKSIYSGWIYFEPDASGWWALASLTHVFHESRNIKDSIGHLVPDVGSFAKPQDFEPSSFCFWFAGTVSPGRLAKLIEVHIGKYQIVNPIEPEP